jgi:7,8-dihydropterin-6-yl-methyl-4-(beta-D-ribofuranosyl)aminobenzene 5'-phosphate synthase
MQTRLTILCENSVGVPFDVLGEHGFSCFIETAQGNYLFDTGQGYTIAANAAALNKDLRSIRAVMISHGHYDHTGGLPAVLKQRGPVDVFGHSAMFSRRIWSRGETERDIGIPFRRAYLESLGARFCLGRDFVEVGPGVFLSGEITRNSSFEQGDPNMTRINPDGSRVHPDPLDDDLSLVVRTGKGLVVVLGCAHAGMINILEHITARFPDDQIYAVIGGTHLGFSSDEQFEATLARIDEYGIQRLGVSHCTGLERAAMLHARLGERFFFGTVGAVLEG